MLVSIRMIFLNDINNSMRFKQLIEMPHYTRYSAKCPKGDIVDGSVSDYKFDYGAEFFKKDYPEYYEKLQQNFGLLSQGPSGVLPVYCSVHDLLFMFDFDNNEYLKPRGEKDIFFLHLVKDGITKVRKRDNLPSTEIKIYK